MHRHVLVRLAVEVRALRSDEILRVVARRVLQGDLPTKHLLTFLQLLTAEVLHFCRWLGLDEAQRVGLLEPVIVPEAGVLVLGESGFERPLRLHYMLEVRLGPRLHLQAVDDLRLSLTRRDVCTRLLHRS